MPGRDNGEQRLGFRFRKGRLVLVVENADWHFEEAELMSLTPVWVNHSVLEKYKDLLPFDKEKKDDCRPIDS
jgi:hypothetical protein